MTHLDATPFTTFPTHDPLEALLLGMEIKSSDPKSIRINLSLQPILCRVHLRKRIKEQPLEKEDKYKICYLKKLQLGGPLRESILRKFVPGPGKYDSAYSTLNVPPISMKSRIPDKSLDHLKKVNSFPSFRFQVQAPTTINKSEQTNTMSNQNTRIPEVQESLQGSVSNQSTGA